MFDTYIYIIAFVIFIPIFFIHKPGEKKENVIICGYSMLRGI